MKEAGPQDQFESDEDEIADQMKALNKIMKRQETPQKQQASQKSIISSNKYVKSDLDELEKLCDGLNKETRRCEDEERDQRSAKRKQARQTQNMFKKADDSQHDTKSDMDKKFEVFATAVKPADPEKPN